MILVQVWESGAHVLALVSDDDGQISPHWADEWKKSCPAEKQQLLDVVHYPGAGHLLEPPYTPHCRVCINPSYGKFFGYSCHSPCFVVKEYYQEKRIQITG